MLLVLVAQIEINLFEYAQSAAVTEPITSVGLSTRADAFENNYRMMEAVPNKNSPIVLLDDLDFLPIIHYAPANIAPRLVYILYPGLDVNGQGFIGLRRLCRAPGRFETMSDFLSTHDTFIARCKTRSFYRLDDFIREGADVRMESISADSFLVSITLKKKLGASAATPLH